MKNKAHSKTSSSFPLDLTLEIFLKLPVKSVLRFRCVSKLWSSIPTDPYFTSSFVTRSTKKTPSLLLCFKRCDDLFVFSIPHHHQTLNEPYSVSSLPVDIYRTPYPKHCSFSPKELVHGLICFSVRETAKPMVWNPSTRQFLTLPKPETRWTRITVFLGYDPVEGKHKVVCMPFNNSSDECRVSTLGSPPWRRIKTNHSHRSVDNTSHECINGVLYYKAYTDQTDDVAIIMSFDVRSEKFHMIKLPWNSIGVVLTSYEGKLACVRINNEDHCSRLWILEDAEKHDWSRIDFPGPIPYFDESLKSNFYFIGITSDGEFVYIPVWLDNSFYILYCDPKRNRFHRVEFMGIADDEFRLKNGFGDTHLCTHDLVVLNHIESLISL